MLFFRTITTLSVALAFVACTNSEEYKVYPEVVSNTAGSKSSITIPTTEEDKLDSETKALSKDPIEVMNGGKFSPLSAEHTNENMVGPPSPTEIVAEGEQLPPAPIKEDIAPQTEIALDTPTVEKPASETPKSLPVEEAPTVVTAPAPQPKTTEASIAAMTSDKEELDFIVSTSHLNVRAGPGMGYPVIRVLRNGYSFRAMSIEGIWVQVGSGEYVSRHYLRGATSKAPQDEYVDVRTLKSTSAE